MKTAATLLLACTLALVPSAALVAQQVCPCVPLTHEWIIEPCENWNCAAAAAILANGDKYVIAIPSNSDDFKWLILRRVVGGSVAMPADAPFRVAAFDGPSEAMARYSSLGEEFSPMMLTAPDGKFLVLSRSVAAPRRRAASH